ncbi:MAG: caspase family protein, partial [Mariprofundales bacterium]|nr:caspase family protein [Mariprofundales bacterium]
MLIGESIYTSGWPNLEHVPAELIPVERVLQAQGFTVKKVINADAVQLQQVMKTFIDRYGFDTNNRLLFYYSGHGYTRKNGSKGYLVPTDAPDPRKDEKGFLRKALNMTQILAWSREIEAKHVLFLFDSCFSGTIFKARALPDTPPQISAMTARPVRQFITAGSAGETVPARSVFTPAFVDGLQYGLADLNKDGYISGTELGLYLQQEVPQHTHETPQYGKISDYDLSRGDFIMLAQGSAVESIPQAPSAPSIVTVITQPAGAMVFANGMQQGPAPISLRKLTGRVVITAKK